MRMEQLRLSAHSMNTKIAFTVSVRNTSQSAITFDDVAVIDASKCVDCGACVDECPSSAISE